jgi:hypothetical protein
MTSIHPPMAQIILTPSHLGIILENVGCGELLDAVTAVGRLPEDVARYFFQQMIISLEYCHSKVRLLVFLDRRSGPRFPSHASCLARLAIVSWDAATCGASWCGFLRPETSVAWECCCTLVWHAR